MKLKNNKDFVTIFFSQLSHKLHPSLGKLYDKHTKFFNFGLVELVCLIIANASIGILSYSYIGLALVLLSFCVVTPITFVIKYFANKIWVWSRDDS